MPTIIASDMICRHACLLDLNLETAEMHGRLQFFGDDGAANAHRPAAVQETVTGRHVVLCDECRQTLWWVLSSDPKQIEIVRRGLERDREKREGTTMTETIYTCDHIKTGAPVAGTLRGAAGGPNGDHFTFQACANCLAQASGALTQTGKGGYSVGDSGRYFGSKLG